ncbi:MAG: hypothetical protein AAGC92_15060 [Pseudomonadota bacterium]
MRAAERRQVDPALGPRPPVAADDHAARRARARKPLSAAAMRRPSPAEEASGTYAGRPRQTGSRMAIGLEYDPQKGEGALA